MERTAWFCPACQKHHAPHVETCPGGAGLGLAPLGPAFTPEMNPRCHVCGMIFDGVMSYVCPRANCPTSVRCATTVLLDGVATTRAHT